MTTLALSEAANAYNNGNFATKIIGKATLSLRYETAAQITSAHRIIDNRITVTIACIQMTEEPRSI